MKLYLVTLALIAITAVVQSGPSDRWSQLHKLWQQYKAKYQWAYPSLEEERFRFELFSKRLQQVEEHNARNLGWTEGINHLSVLTKEELSGLVSDLPTPDYGLRTPYELDILDRSDVGELPANFSWLDVPGVVGPVKSQGHCGSCWAFATVALIESRQLFAGYNFTSLSEQQLVDCVENGNKTGCSGNHVYKAVGYVIQSGGLESEQNYPYVSGKGETQMCRFNKYLVEPYTQEIKGFSYLDCANEEELKRVLVRYGPVGVSIRGDFRGFYGYKSGILTGEDDNPDADDGHAILLVGYGTTEDGRDFWILKNSWSNRWGMGGFFWMARNRNLMKILSRPAVVFLEAEQDGNARHN